MSAAEPSLDALETVLVSSTPIMGTGIPLGQVPSNVQTVRATQIDEEQAATITEVAEQHFSSVVLSDTEGNRFQEDLVARGFTASPVLGTPQGLAVYQDGVRINEPFGDVVLWDFVPVFAIEELQEIPGSNAVFGLNALGGALTVETKNGFDSAGTKVELSGGTFGRYGLTGQYGMQDLGRALYLGVSATHEKGWRELSSSDVVQSIFDAALRDDEYKLGATLTLASGRMNGNGADPAQDDPKAAFAVPDLESDRLIFLQTRGTIPLGHALSLEATAYVRYVDITIQNGAASGFSRCGKTVCNDSGPLALVDGSPVSPGSGYDGMLPVATTRTLSLGNSLQVSMDGSIGERSNVAHLGASFDQGRSDFSHVTFLGKLAYLSPPGTTTYSNGLQLAGAAYNVRLDALNRYYGLFFTDTLSVTDSLSATVSGRLNRAQVDLSDLVGDALTGSHLYQRFNPAAGVTYRLSPSLNLYASYSESNRIPTPAELSCANPDQPCTFPLSFISDPELRQVVARSIELGVRGGAAANEGRRLDWFADVYGTRNSNDILFVSSGPLIGSGYFTNGGATKRLGAEAVLEGGWGNLDFHANYGYVRATFLSHLRLLSDNNPGADASGDILVQPGDRLPSVPLHTVKFGVGYSLPGRVHAALDGIVVSSRYLRGDEANLQEPLPAYAVLNARMSWQATPELGFFLRGENILDHRYSSYGLYGDPTGNGAFPRFTVPRFYTPAAPFGLWAGVQLSF